MDWQNSNEGLRDYEAKARELVSLTLAVCDGRLAVMPKNFEPPQEALAATAMCVRDSVEAFLAVTRMSSAGETSK